MTSFSAPLDNTVAEEKVDFSSTSVEYQMMKEKKYVTADQKHFLT
jgi:hypothetical protein